MTTAAPWLPANALNDGVLASSLTSCAAKWHERWTSDGRPTQIRLRPVSGRVSMAADASVYSAGHSGLFVVATQNALRMHAMAMLALPPAVQRLNDTDQTLLRALATLSISDLLEHVALTLSLSSNVNTASEIPANLSGYQSQLSAGTQTIDFYLTESAAVHARKALLARPQPREAPASLAAALARQKLRIGAIIGTGMLSLSDLSALQCGDVLVLDRGPKDDALLTINGQRSSAIACQIFPDANTLKLEVKHMNGGMQ